MKAVNKSKTYLEENVLDASRRRISEMFDRFELIWVSVSGGKDSSVLFDLVYREAEKRNRTINVFFLDQEAEYESSIEIVRHIMSKPLVTPCWFQIPLIMTSCVSYEQDYLHTWCEDEKDKWLRPKESTSIHDYPFKSNRFYGFIDEYTKKHDNSCWFVGLRAEESLNRFRAMKKKGFEGKNWTTIIDKKRNIVNAYPIYDYTFEDVWKYIFSNEVKYNRVYDVQFMLEYNINEMRVSNLIHEMSYKCLRDLPKIEPQTYEKLQRRLKGIATAQRYAKKIQVFNANKLPKDFRTYKDWRNNLLVMLPLKSEKKELFESRFERQIKKNGEHEYIYKHHVRQLLLNDWENNIPLVVRREVDIDKYKKWKELL